jgi:hypothetical protein
MGMGKTEVGVDSNNKMMRINGTMPHLHLVMTTGNLQVEIHQPVPNLWSNPYPWWVMQRLHDIGMQTRCCERQAHVKWCGLSISQRHGTPLSIHAVLSHLLSSLFMWCHPMYHCHLNSALAASWLLAMTMSWSSTVAWVQWGWMGIVIIVGVNPPNHSLQWDSEFWMSKYGVGWVREVSHGLAELTSTYLRAGKWKHHLHSPIPLLLIIVITCHGAVAVHCCCWHRDWMSW